MKKKILSLFCVLMLIVNAFALVVINASAAESETPVDNSALVSDVYAYVTDSGELQVRVIANENSMKYRLYEKATADGDWAKIDESGFPVLYTDSYNSESLYAVSVISYFDGAESELVEIENYTTDPIEYDGTNILLGKNVTYPANSNCDHYTNLGYDMLTDGKSGSNNRYSNKSTHNMDATIDLGAEYLLSELRLCIYNNQTIQIGSNFTVKVRTEQQEEWTTVVGPLTADEMRSNYMKPLGTGVNDKFLFFDLGGIKAKEINIFAEPEYNVTTGLNNNYKWITFNEAEASGILVNEAKSGSIINGGFSAAFYEENVLLGKTFAPTQHNEEDIIYGATHPYSELTDGTNYNDNNRLSSKQNGLAEATVNLDGEYQLSELRFYYYQKKTDHFGKELTINLYRNDEKTTVYNYSTSQDILAAHDPSVSGCLIFDLTGYTADKIEFIIPSTDTNGYISFYEIECSGMQIPSASVETTAIGNAFDGNDETYASLSGSDAVTIDLPVSKGLLHSLTVKELIEEGASASDVKIEVYHKNRWLTAYDVALVAEGTSEFNFYAIECSKIRITFSNDGGVANISEISCEMSRIPTDIKEMALALNQITTVDMSDDPSVRYDQVFNHEVYNRFKSYVRDFNADQTEINAYTEEIKEFCNETQSITFSPKTSITLGSELVYNIYVPKVDYLKSYEAYTTDGTNYESESVVTLEDGNDYYLIAVKLPSYAAARTIVLKATVTVGDKDYTGTWTVSIPKYAKKIIDTNKTEEVELVKNVLAYIKSAYTYFEKELNETTKNEIDKMLEGHTVPFEKVDGTIEISEGIKAVAFTLKETPIVRFYLTGNAEDYTFSAKVTDSGEAVYEGKTYDYVDISLYAYQMIDEITYTVGDESGSYHINSYYNYVTGDDYTETDKEALIDLVEKFYNYCKSAAEYRDSVNA